LGKGLKEALGDKIHCFEDWDIRDCWAYKLLEENPDLLPATACPPTDRFTCPQDMVLSNIVLMLRFILMADATVWHPDVDTFVWIEYTILKQRGVTPQVLQEFMKAVEEKDYKAISLPGCWDKQFVDDSVAHWRFCGSCWVCPREYVLKVFEAIKALVSLRARITGKLSMDMNSWAYLELLDILPIRWYKADHGASQFTNY
jgi:hypothetical protein